MNKRTLLIIAAASLTSAAASAQTPAACTATAEVPPAFAGWQSARPLAAKPLGIGESARVPLARDVRFAATTSKATEPGSYAAAVPVTIAEAGVYEVALSEGAWLDLVQDGKPLPSTAHRHGPACSTLHKIVAFRLTPGRYSLQISNSPAPQVTVEVVKVG